MNTKIVQKNNITIAIVQSTEPIITDVQSALDFMSTVRYETGCDRIALNKEAIKEEFFDLSTRIAGEILQKFINYNVKFAIIGDFSCYSSKALRDFIYESNRGKNIFFISDEYEAIERLSSI